MEWKDVRAHYKALFSKAKDVGETQTTVAARGGLTQPDLSRMLQTGGLGPHVDTLIRAIKGLDISVAEFFLQVERQTDGDLSAPAGAGRTARTPEGRVSDGREAAAVSLDPTTLLKAGNALVDAGGLFIAAAHGVEVKPRARARDRADQPPARQRRRAGGNR